MLLGWELNRPFSYWQRAGWMAKQKASELRTTVIQLLDGHFHFSDQSSQARTCSDGPGQRDDSSAQRLEVRQAPREAVLKKNVPGTLGPVPTNVSSASKLSIVSLGASGDFCAIRDASGATLGTGKREFCEVLIRVLDSQLVLRKP